MYLLLIRHTESEKNINNQFSSENDDEKLTLKGKRESLYLSYQIKEFMDLHKLSCKNIYSANSARSRGTSKIIAKELNLNLCFEDALRSTKPGILSGKSEEEAKKSNPEYMQQYYLFRKGLFNVYNFNVPDNKEPKKRFEKRVLGCLTNILLDKSESIKIIIAHRSSITSILMEFSRKYYNYPSDFSGYVQLDLGYISLLKKDEENNWEILKVNEKDL
jgi:broad specificity phosphatase PhoE